MEVILLLIRIFLAGVFALAGVGKLLDLDGSEKAVKDFGVPDELATPLSFLLPGVELLFAFLLLPLSTSWFGALGAFLLLTVFIVAMLFQIAKGNAPDCHCFGAIHSEPVSVKSLLRNAVFAGLAGTLVVRGRAGQGIGITELPTDMAMQLIVGIAVIGLLLAVLHSLKSVSEQQKEIIRRIDVIEFTAAEGGREVARQDAGHPDDALPVGSVVADFELPDVNGRIVKFEHLLAGLKPMLFFFASPTCGPCEALLPEISKWKEEFGGKLEIVFFSSGDAKINASKFGAVEKAPILLQKDREIANYFFAKWTPSAVLVSADGTVASRLAVGDVAIRNLVDSIRGVDLEGSDVFVPTDEKSRVGQMAPTFSMTDVGGREITDADLKGRRTLVAFWSLTCPHCDAMAPDLRAWEAERADGDPELVVFSNGDDEGNRRLGLAAPVIVDKEYATSAGFGMLGTPSAVLVNEDGRIASETAIGAGNIWALIGKRKL